MIGNWRNRSMSPVARRRSINLIAKTVMAGAELNNNMRRIIRNYLNTVPSNIAEIYLAKAAKHVEKDSLLVTYFK